MCFERIMTGSATLTLDHLVVVAPDLAEGVAWVEDCLGVRAPEGGRHDGWGTRNHLMRIGETLFLEIIAVDDAAAAPAQPRWFELGDPRARRAAWDEGRRLAAFVCRTPDLPATLAAAGPEYGAARRVTRGDLAWTFGVTPDGAIPHGGAAPYVMDWGAAGTPAARMADLGCRLRSFVIESPDPAALATEHRRIGLADGPELRRGRSVRLLAVFDTPSGPRLLT